MAAKFVTFQYACLNPKCPERVFYGAYALEADYWEAFTKLCNGEPEVVLPGGVPVKMVEHHNCFPDVVGVGHFCGFRTSFVAPYKNTYTPDDIKPYKTDPSKES
jgi:hypothetical protein